MSVGKTFVNHKDFMVHALPFKSDQFFFCFKFQKAIETLEKMEGAEAGAGWLPNKNVPKLGSIVARWIANNLNRILKTEADEEKIKYAVTSETREAILKELFENYNNANNHNNQQRYIAAVKWLERHPSLLHNLNRVDWMTGRDRGSSQAKEVLALLNRYCANSLSYLGSYHIQITK